MTRRAVALVAVSLAACGGDLATTDGGARADAPCGDAGFEPTPVARDLATLPFDPSTGRTAVLTLPAGGARYARVALRDPLRCAQIDALVDGDGRTLVEPGDFGPYCARCSARNAVVVGAGLFALPALAAGARLSFTLRGCEFFGSLRPLPADESLSVSLLDVPPRDARATARLELAVFAARGSWLADAPVEAIEAVLRGATTELADARVTLSLRGRCVLDALPADVEAITGDHAALLRAVEASRSTCAELASSVRAGSVAVFGLRCLTLVDRARGERARPYGYTTHIPGGGGGDAADGVVLSDGCVASSGAAPPYFTRVLAHELGHYLGLYHSVERDGRVDTLDDTGEANLMNALPTLAAARGLSTSQVEIARRHPALRWPAAAVPGCASP